MNTPDFVALVPAHELPPFARILDVSEDEYHADPCEVPSLSQSIAHKMVAFSPLHAWTAHPKLGKQQEAEEEDTRARVDGKVVHRLLLGKGADIVVCQFNDFRSNRAKDARDEALAAGKVPVIEHRYAEAAAAAEILREKLAAKGYVFDGDSEVAIEWDEDGERGPVRCRGRLDHLKLGQHDAQILDVKKIRSAHPNTCRRHIYDFGYDIQWTAYPSAVAKLQPLVQEIDFVILFVEIEPPYAVTPVRKSLCPAYAEIGRMRWDRAVLLWERCLATNRWPEYAPDEAIGVEPMPYVLQQEIGSGNW